MVMKQPIRGHKKSKRIKSPKHMPGGGFKKKEKSSVPAKFLRNLHRLSWKDTLRTRELAKEKKDLTLSRVQNSF